MNLEGLQTVATGDEVIAPLFARWSADRYHPDRPDGVIGASNLGKCSRAMAYRMLKTPATNPMTESGQHATGLGTAVHLGIQEQAPKDGAIDGVVEVQIEAPWSYTIPVEGSDVPVRIESEADLSISYLDDAVEVVDIKTMAPFGFKMKCTKEGPDRGAILQIVLAMRALRAEHGLDEHAVRGRLVMISSAELKGYDRIDKQPGEYDFRANRYREILIYDRDEVAALADQEEARLAKIRRYIDAGDEGKIPRTIPGVTPKGATIVDPLRGVWQLWTQGPESGSVLVDQGDTWHCRYCDWQDQCAADLEEGSA